MHRINTSYFYRLAQKLMPLGNFVPRSALYFENYMVLSGAQEELTMFLGNALLSPMTSFNSGKALLEAVEKITKEVYDEARIFEWGEPESLKELLRTFEISLQSDFAIRDTFIVSPKSTHSTTQLCEYGQNLVSLGVRELVPDIEKDLKDAARCIAFELPTAGAFHLFRAVEAVVRHYGEFVLGRRFTSGERNGGLGAMSNCLKNKKIVDPVDDRITGTIDYIAQLHRNPTMHPDWHISNTEVMTTMGLTCGMMETVAVDWNRRKTEPTTRLSDILPDDMKVSALLEETNEPPAK